MTLKSSPNPTWLDLKQLFWAWLLVLPFIALGAYGAHELIGWSSALWMGFWLAVLVTVVFLSIVVVSLVMSYLDDWHERNRTGHPSDPKVK